MYKSIAALSLAVSAAAHQNFHQFWVNEVSPGYQVAIRMPPSNSPVTDVTSDDIACNVNGSIVPSDVTTYAANEGDSITVNWDISSHPGPITHFLFGPVDDAAQATGIGAGWFKIDELDYENDEWANQVLSDNGGNYTFTLPTGLESGDYLLRSEMLALHAAQTVGGAQFYIGCAQLTITGTGGGCSPSISLPGAYSAEDDDIYIPDVYNGFDPTTYTAPGGSVAVCGTGSATPATSTAAGSSSAAAATSTEAATSTVGETSAVASTSINAATSSVKSTQVAVTSLLAASTLLSSSIRSNSTLATVTATSSAAPSSTGSSGTVQLYYQCGGINWTGATECVSGSTCVVMNDFYSQCVAS
ncbi:glycosyl hydrolase family 61-domain-containing protein [Xylariaceae sp. FL1272]|nr:glycosyl hydrolase family 61-domain-containing protein [Xylariaceae sp. FL1272]